MKSFLWRVGLLASLMPLLLFALGGCGKDAQETPKTEQKKESKGHDHSAWWCDEHGVPEAECSMCSAKVAAECKKKGDWCDKHDRARSQCFICDPSLEAKFAARYEARYGKKPPVPTENRAKGEDKK
jgi:hypothetical protein